jgi:hypothetical protein
MANGKAGEVMLELLLQEAGVPNVASSYNRELLLQTVRELRPGRLENVQDRRTQAGRPTRWESTPSKLILDWVYGLDIVVKPGPSQVFGYDVTCNLEKVAAKISKLRDFRPLWESLGITRVGVILLTTPDEEWGWATLSREKKENLVENLLDQVVYATDEADPLSVRCYTLTI